MMLHEKPPKKKRRAPYRGAYLQAYGKGNWRVCWRVNGKLKSKSFDSLAAAEAERTAILDRMKSHGSTGLSGVDAQSLAELRMIRDALAGASVSDLLAVWQRHKAEVLGGEAGLTLDGAAARFLALIKKEGVEGANLAQYELHLARLGSGLGERPLVAVSADELRAFFDNLHTVRGKKIAKATGWTLISHHKSVRALFARAKLEGWRADDPMEKVRSPEKPVEEVEFLSVEAGRKLFEKNKDQPIAMRLALEAFAGLRYSGSGRLELSEVNFEERTLLIPASKSKDGKRHLLDALPDNAWAFLERWRHDPRAWAFTERQHLAAKSAAFTRAAVVNSGNVLRHSFCTYHIAQRKDAALTAVLMQHTNPSMLYRHYRGAAPASDAALWFAIHPWGPFIPEPGDKQVESAVS